MKQHAAKPFFDATGGRVLPDRSDVDFVLFMPGDHYEIVEDDAFEDAAHEEHFATDHTSVGPTWIDIEDEVSEELASEFDSGAHYDESHARATWIAYEDAAPYESHSARGSLWADDDEELETLPEARLDDDITQVRVAPVELTWWEAAKRGLRAISTTTTERTWWEAARRGLRSRG